MNILSILLTGIGLSMDAFAVSVTNGMQIKHVRFADALRIAFSFGFFQALMPVVGYFTGILFSDAIAALDHWVAFLILAVIGGKMIWEATTQKKGNKTPWNSQRLSLRTLVVLSIATSIDALAVGVSFAVLRTGIWQAVGIIGVTTFCLCLPGVYIGHRFGALFKNKAEIFGGVILIAIGLKILLKGIF